MESETESGASLGSGIAMKLVGVVLVAIVLFFLARAYLGPRQSLAGWENDWDAGVTRAAQTGKPMLVLFTADWCAPCQQLKREVLSDDAVARRLESEYTLIKVDLTDPQSPGSPHAQKFSVRGIPTLILFAPDGTQIARRMGGTSPEGFLAWLDEHQRK